MCKKLRELKEEISRGVIEIQQVTDQRKYTCVVVHTKLPDGITYATIGFASCCPKDHYDPHLGHTIATGRAITALARQLQQSQHGGA